jgi:hypothetical protein
VALVTAWIIFDPCLIDHVAGGVVQIEQRRARLAADLNEMRRLVGARRIERTVIGDDPDRLAFDPRVPAHRGRTVIGAKLSEIGIIDNPRDHLAHIDRTLVVHRHDAQQFLGVMTRRAMHRRVRARPVPFQIGHDVARNTQSVAVVFGEIVAETGNTGMHLGAAEFLLGGDLSGCGLQQRRACEKGAGAAAHHHDVIRQAGLVGAARGG